MKIEPKPLYAKVNISCAEAGHLGGIRVLQQYGRQHYVNAGKKGQITLKSRYTHEDRSRWGKMGGRPRRKTLTGGGK